jgi:5-methyltetrahydrofolate--homocysteine methyltransferase
VAAIDRLRDLLARRIVVLDGAVGTMLTGVVNRDGLVLSHPDRVARVHEAYLEAGADIISTNTFRATSIAQAAHGLGTRTYDLNVAAARLARSAADEWSRRSPAQPRFVAGSVGPAHATPEALRDAYAQQVRGLIDGGADLLLFETIVDTRAAGAAVAAIANEFARCGASLPAMFSATTDQQGRLPSGETLEAFVGAVHEARPFSLGVNCSEGVRGMQSQIEELARYWDSWISCHPSAGLPDVAGTYGDRPEDLASVLQQLAQAGLVNIVGGCCGTTPDYTRAIHAAVATVPIASIRSPHGRSRPSPEDR